MHVPSMSRPTKVLLCGAAAVLVTTLYLTVYDDEVYAKGTDMWASASGAFKKRSFLGGDGLGERSRATYGGNVGTTLHRAIIRPSVKLIYSLPQVPTLYPSGSSCPASCPADPFGRPGMLRLSANPGKDYADTVWVPFPSGSAAAYGAPAQNLREACADAAAEVPESVMRGVERQWTKELAQHGASNGEHQAGTGGQGDAADAVDVAERKRLDGWEWARGRTIVFFGSSHDRNNVQQFCTVVQGKYTSWGLHIGGFCRIEHLDLVIANWFSLGMVDDDKLDGWREEEVRPITFERRIPDIMIPLMRDAGLQERGVDMMVMASLFWDEHLLRHYSFEQFRPADTPTPPGLSYAESTWQRSRLTRLVELMREMYGADVPLMFRTRHLRAKTGDWALLVTEQLDQGVRSVAREMGVREFRWGELMVGYNQYYDNDQHFGVGPNTYLFGE